MGSRNFRRGVDCNAVAAMNEHAATRLIERLARFPAVLESMCAVVSAEDARWKPAPEHWSILEVAAHLLDEEKEDFSARIRSTLEDPSRAWPPLILDGVAEKRGYNQRDMGATLREFRSAREANIAWLRSAARTADWTVSYQHPKVGALAAGMLLASWSAHDALHMRQISKRLYELAARDGAPFSIEYAGGW